MEHFWEGFEKRAEDFPWKDVAEVAGLGGLMYPAYRHFRKKLPLSEGAFHKLDVAALGTLAAPSVYNIGKWVHSKFKKPKQA